MPIKCLTIVVYAETGWDWHFENTFNPTWDVIVASIDRELVLRTARHFGETNEPLPEAMWESV